MAGTDKTQKFDYRPSPAVILCEPQLGENIGTTARAMANFGLWDLRLVNPRDGWPNEKAVAAASRADHVIEKVRVYPTTEAAIEDLSLVYATTARRRDLQKPVLGPEEASQRVIAHIDTGAKAGILFGRERWGLYNEEVALSDAIVTLPVEAAFASLNIAQWEDDSYPTTVMSLSDTTRVSAARVTTARVTTARVVSSHRCAACRGQKNSQRHDCSHEATEHAWRNDTSGTARNPENNGCVSGLQSYRFAYFGRRR